MPHPHETKKEAEAKEVAQEKRDAAAEKAEKAAPKALSQLATQAALEVFDSEFIRANDGDVNKAAAAAVAAGKAFEAAVAKANE